MSNILLQIAQQVETLCSKLSCTKHQLRTGLDVFIRTLEQMTVQLGQPGGDHLVDSTRHHFWSVPSGCINATNWDYMVGKSCACGAVTNADGKLGFKFIGESGIRKMTSDNDDGCCEIASISADNDEQLVKLWDSLSVLTGALQNAVLTANMLLGVHSYIQNTN